MNLPLTLRDAGKLALVSVLVALSGWLIWYHDIPPNAPVSQRPARESVTVTPRDELKVLVLMAHSEYRAVALKAVAGLCLALRQKQNDFEWWPVSATECKAARVAAAKSGNSQSVYQLEFEDPDRVREEFVDTLWWDAAHSAGTAIGSRSILIRHHPNQVERLVTFSFGYGEEFGPRPPALAATPAASPVLKNPVDVIYGPTATRHVQWILGYFGARPPTHGSSRPAHPGTWRPKLILSPTATTSNVAPQDLNTTKFQFLRWMTPNEALATRLAREVALGLRPRRMALIYASDLSARGLRNDFVTALKDYQYPKYVHWDKPQPGAEMRFPRGLWHAAQLKAEREAAAKTLGHPPTQPDAGEKATEDFIDQLPVHLTMLRNQRTDAVCLFGTTEDKLFLIPFIQRYLPRVPIFTTHADVGLEQLVRPQNIFVVSALDLRSPKLRDELQEAQDFVMPRFVSKSVPKNAASAAEDRKSEPDPPIYPDVYMLTSEEAASFTLHLLAQVSNSKEIRPQIAGYIAQDPQQTESGSQRSVCPGTASSATLNFQTWGDRILDPSQTPQLLVLTSKGLESAEYSKYNSVTWDRSFRHPLPQYLLAFILIWAWLGIVDSSGGWKARRHQPNPGEPSPPVVDFVWERWLARLPGRIPRLMQVQLVFTALFVVFLVTAYLRGSEPVTFVPNGVSSVPSAFLLCQLGAISLWTMIRNRDRIIDEIPRFLKQWGCEGMADTFAQEAQRVFDGVRAWDLLAWLSAVLFVGIDYYALGFPISCLASQRLFVILSVVSFWALFTGIAFVSKTRVLASWLTHQLQEQPFPVSYRHLHLRCQVLIVPFVDVTVWATFIMLGVVAARWRGIDAWNWSPFPYCLLFTLVTLLLCAALFDIHYRWHRLLRSVRQDSLRSPQPRPAAAADGERVTEPPTGEEFEKRIEALEKASTWVWTPQMALRSVLVVASPLLALLLQQKGSIDDLIQALRSLLGGA